ncbi:MAG: alpha/beta fold hydrolase [Chloroflexi bacterium]|nr:alpha/beta fold hydrolase [Chloroflexota bacterium]
MPRALLFLAVLIGVLALAYLGIAVYVADRFARPKRVALSTTPAAFGLAYEHVEFRSAVDDILLRGWFIPATGGKTIVILHGRESARADEAAGIMPLASALVRRGYNVLMFDFRGHGESNGNLYSLGQWEVRDVGGALSYLKSRGVANVGVLGYSMGAATALLAAPEHPEIRAIVADAPFSDLSVMIDEQFPKATGLPRVFIPGVHLMVRLMHGLDLAENKPQRAMARLDDRPVMLIHGSSDDYIPVEHAYALRRAGAGNPNLETWIAPGSGHVQSFNDHPDEYIARIASFFDRHLARV